MSRAAHSSQDWDYEKGHLLGFLSVTPFSDLLLKGNLFSYAPLTQDMECFLALWRLLFAWLCSCSIFLLPKAALYEDTETCVSANKAPLFHSRLGSPESFFPSTPVPGVPVYKDCDKWRPNRDLVNALGKRMEWLLGPTEVGKCGVIGQMAGKPHHFSTFLHHLFKVQGLSVLRQRIEACLQSG